MMFFFRFRRESQEVWEQIKIDENGEETQTDPDPVEIKIKVCIIRFIEQDFCETNQKKLNN